LSLIRTSLLAMMKKWNWSEIKEEVDRGHREFFLRRGIDPYTLKEDFLFGFTKHASNPSLSSHQSDQPSSQSYQDLDRNRDNHSSISE
jgi:hypothetical protein